MDNPKGPPVTLADALTLRQGDYLCTPHTMPRRRPVRVTEVWVNERRTIVMVRLASIRQNDWLDATGYEHPPAGLVWDNARGQWITPEVWDQRYKGSGALKPRVLYRGEAVAHG